MEKAEKIEAYFAKESPFKEGLKTIRKLLKNTALVEEWKWSFPCYTLNGKNVLGLGSFKNHFGIWFFQGCFLVDQAGLLRNAQKGKTKAMRSLHYENESEINEALIVAYVQEAIANSRAGKEVTPSRKAKNVQIPIELQSHFNKDSLIQNAFQKLSPGKQREYAEHIGSAKQEATRVRRLKKCIPMILKGIGLHDKYKNC